MQECNKVSDNLQDKYDGYYNELLTIGREFAARYKAANIINLLPPHDSSAVYKILDCGAGEGSVVRLVEKSQICGEIYGLEISDSAIEIAMKRQYEKLVEFKKFDGYSIDYPDGYFDVAYCTHVI